MTEKSIDELEAEIKILRKEMKSLKEKGKAWDALPIALLINVLERDLKKQKERDDDRIAS